MQSSLQFLAGRLMRLSCTVMGCAIMSATLCAQSPKAADGFFTTSDGVRLHYLEAGTGPAIVFVPGWCMPAWIWENQIQHFSAHYHVIALDPRSQGDSDKPGQGNFPERRAQDVKDLVDQLKLAPAILVGWSQAVPELLTYAEKFGGASVRGYVLVDGLAWEKANPQLISGMMEIYPQVEGNRHDLTEKFVRSMYHKPVSEEYIERLVDSVMKTPSDSAVAMSVTSIARDDWRPAIAKIDRPVLVACEPGMKAMAADPITSKIPTARVEVFPDAGHALFVDDADRFNALLDDFIQHAP